jgi:hypothetical protein
LRSSSREIVGGLRPSRSAIERIDPPERDLLPFGERQTTALQPTPPARTHPARLGQHPAAGPPARVDHRDRISDEAAIGHHLPEPLQQVQDERRSNTQPPRHPISQVLRSPGELADALAVTKGDPG